MKSPSVRVEIGLLNIRALLLKCLITINGTAVEQTVNSQLSLSLSLPLSLAITRRHSPRFLFFENFADLHTT